MYGGSGDGYRLVTPDGVVSAAKLVFATNAYSHLFGELASKQAPAFTYMIATEPLTDAHSGRSAGTVARASRTPATSSTTTD